MTVPLLLIHPAFKLLGWFLHFQAAQRALGVGVFFLRWSPGGIYLCFYILYLPHTSTAQRRVSHPGSRSLSIYSASFNFTQSAVWTYNFTGETNGLQDGWSELKRWEKGYERQEVCACMIFAWGYVFMSDL